MKKEDFKKLVVETIKEAVESDESLQELFGLSTPGVKRGVAGSLAGGRAGGGAAMTPALADAALAKLVKVAADKITSSAEGAQLKAGDILSNAEQLEVLQALNAKTGGKYGENVGAAFNDFARKLVQPTLKHTQIQEGITFTVSKKA